MQPIKAEIVQPNGKFLLVIGTSHTHGACQDRGRKNLYPEERWATLLGNSLGIEIVNHSMPGVINNQITELLMDCIDAYNMNNCIGILIECRYGVGGSYFAYDNFADYDDFANEKKLNRLINNTTRSRDITTDGENDYLPCAFNEFFSVYAGGKVTSPGYFERLLSNAFYPLEPPKRAVNDLRQYLELVGNFYHRSDHAFWDDMREVRVWETIAKGLNIPFKWFHWGKRTSDTMLRTFVLEEYKLMDTNILDDGKGVCQFVDEYRYHCECHHLNAEGNVKVFELLEPKVREWLKI